MSTIADGIAVALSCCVIQPSEHGAPFRRPACVSDSGTSTEHTIVRVDTGADDDGLSAFLSAQARLFGIAYRMLRSAAEAEDVVQDVWIRWQRTDRSTVRDAAAFLATTTTRVAINVLQSARSRREIFDGPSLSESVDTSVDPELEAERTEALQNAVLVLLEKLSPAERAAYVLREAFDYPYREIATLLRLGEANTRQLVTRARQHVADGRHAAVSPSDQRRLLGAFLAAVQNGALTALERLLSSAVARSTVGKDERAARTAVDGGEPVAGPHALQAYGG